MTGKGGMPARILDVRTRMIIVVLLIGVLGFVILLQSVEYKIRPIYLTPIEDDLVEMSTLLSSILATHAVDGRISLSRFETILAHARQRSLDARIYEHIKTGLDLRVYVTDEHGLVIYDSQDDLLVGEDYSEWKDVAQTLAGEYGARFTQEEETFVMYVATPVEIDGRLAGVVSVGKAMLLPYSNFERHRDLTIFYLVLAALLATAMGLLFTAWVTRPIRRLTEYTRALRDGSRQALPDLGSSDIGMLGRSFEELRDALEGKKYVEQYVQTLTHELKSPLSAIKGAAELMDEEMPPERRARFLENIRTETQRIHRLVDRLLELSALESRKGLHNPEAIDLVALMREILAAAEPQAQTRSIQITMDVDRPLPVSGEKFLIRLALSNLVQNALEFTPAGGEIAVVVRQREVCITDSGPGVPDYAGDRVFTRFYSLSRPDSGKKSSGLGLSIAKQVAALHGADISLKKYWQGSSSVIALSRSGLKTKVATCLNPPMNRPEPKPSRPHPSILPYAGPAIGLMITGLVTATFSLALLLLIILGLSVPGADLAEDEVIAGLFGFGLFLVFYGFQIPAGLLVCYSGYRMKNRDQWVLSMIGAIVALLLNLGYCCWLGLPFGVWALIVLTKKDVKATFRKKTHS